MRQSYALPFVFVICLAACSSTPVVYAPTDTNQGPATGRVKPLGELLPADADRVRLVFIHGVNDHCPGYALGEKGWFEERLANRLGFTDAGTPSAINTIHTNVFMGGKKDARSRVEYMTRAFSLKLNGMKQNVPVEAIEITWSHTTQWIKSNYLGYDSHSVTPRPGQSEKDCVEPPTFVVSESRDPPDRLILDRVLKEKVFDRALADALIYSGPYGHVIRKGVTEALCHAIVGTPSDRPCAWPTGADVEKDASAYIFVTHSLGSRIIYDAMLELMGKNGPAKPFISHMLVRTPAFYMMANQLSLLGLTRIPTDASSDQTLKPLHLPGWSLEHMSASGDRPKVDGDTPLSPGCANEIAAIADARLQAFEKKLGTNSNIPSLQIVAFNDTNDLLTWHIPGWYVASGTSGDCRPKVDISNVFVRNAFPWFIAESPMDAHSGYFRNGKVWEVITCGARGDELGDCGR